MNDGEIESEGLSTGDETRGIDVTYVTDTSTEVNKLKAQVANLESRDKVLTDIVMSLNRDLLRLDHDHSEDLSNLKHRNGLLTILIFIGWVAVAVLALKVVFG